MFLGGFLGCPSRDVKKGEELRGRGNQRERERERGEKNQHADWLAAISPACVSPSSVSRRSFEFKLIANLEISARALKVVNLIGVDYPQKKRKKSPVCLLTCVIVGQLWEDGGNWPTPVTSIDGPTAIRDNQQRQFSLFFRGNILRGAVQGNRKLCADTQHMYITDRP